MAGEGKDDVEEIQPDKEGKYPETVSWKQYVGIKESLGNKLSKANEKVTSLEEQLKKAPNTDEFNRISEELKTTKDKLQTTSTELETIKNKSVSEKRETLTKRGIPEDKVKSMSEIELNAAMVVLENIKPGADMGGGGGGSVTLPLGDALGNAVEAYTKK